MENNKENIYEVIVVGAGASGLACSHYLKKFGIHSILLEAKERYGGRTWKSNEKTDYPLELGAEEIYDSAGEYYQLCQKAGAKLFKRKDDQTFVEHPKESRFMKFDEFKQRYPKEADSLELTTEFVEKNPNLKNISCKEYWDRMNLDKMFSFWGEQIMGTENGGDWNNVSLMQIADVEESFPTFDDVFVMKDTSHYDILTYSFADILRYIYLNQCVQTIDYSVKDKIKVTCSNGRVFFCKKIVITVPTSILQRRLIQFQPQLSQQKLQTIDSIGIEPAGKLSIKFKDFIFPQEVAILYIDFKQLIGWVSSDERSNKDYVITFLACGKTCEEIEQNQEKFVHSLLTHLQRLTKVDVFKNKDFVIWHNWGIEKHIHAGHSYDRVGAKENARILYEQDIQQQIYFGGESANLEGKHCCVNGSVDSGIQAAKKMALHIWQDKNNNQQAKL